MYGVAGLYNSFLHHVPYQTWFAFRSLYDFKIDEWKADSVIISDKNSKMYMSPYHAMTLLTERRAWERWYPTNLSDKIVLDIGAGCGETAWFFLKHGAKKVIAVESDSKAVDYLRDNVRRNGWNVEVISETFRPTHLRIRRDFLKMDCEGCEAVLLDERIIEISPCSIELHLNKIGEEACRAIINKFKLSVLTNPSFNVMKGIMITG